MAPLVGFSINIHNQSHNVKMPSSKTKIKPAS